MLLRRIYLGCRALTFALARLSCLKKFTSFIWAFRFGFYRAILWRAQYCCLSVTLSVRLSVCNINVPSSFRCWTYRPYVSPLFTWLYWLLFYLLCCV